MHECFGFVNAFNILAYVDPLVYICTFQWISLTAMSLNFMNICLLHVLVTPRFPLIEGFYTLSLDLDCLVIKAST